MHRDLKPTNIILDINDGKINSPIAKICDFGLSELYLEENP